MAGASSADQIESANLSSTATRIGANLDCPTPFRQTLASDSDSGRYLSPEPMLAEPGYAASMARQGNSVPAYAYADQNPIVRRDDTGLFVADDYDCPNYLPAAEMAWRKSGCGVCDNPNTCANQIKKYSGGCDICPVIKDGQGPLLQFLDHLNRLGDISADRAEDIAAVTRGYTIQATGERVTITVDVRRWLCYDNVDWLASVLIHEAMHTCGGSARIKDPEAGTYNRVFCGSPIPGEELIHDAR